MVIKKKSVLVIDDDPDFIYLIKTILEAKGMTVIEASSIAEAHIVLKKEAPNVIVLDMELQNEHGNDFLEERATNNLWSKIPVIVCSSQSLANVIKTAIRFGADDYLLKPIKQAWLVQRIRKILIQDDNLPYFFKEELEIELIAEAKPVSVSKTSFIARSGVGFDKGTVLNISLPDRDIDQFNFKSEEKSKFCSRGIFDTLFTVTEDTKNDKSTYKLLQNLLEP